MNRRFGRVLRLSFGAVASLALLFLMGIMVQMLLCSIPEIENKQEGAGWQNETPVQEEEQAASARLKELCSTLEDILKKDTDSWIGEDLSRPEEVLAASGLATVKEIPVQGLSEEERLLCGRLEYYYDLYKREESLPDYSPLFSNTTGFLNQLPELFYTWSFDTEGDIENYLQRLENIPRWVESFKNRIQVQMKLKMVYQEETLAAQIEQCRWLYGEESVFLTYFDNRIEACVFLSEKEQSTFSRRNSEAVEKYVKQPLRELELFLAGLEGKDTVGGLAAYARGDEYYDYLLERNTGSGMNAQEMFAYLGDKRQELQEDNFLQDDSLAKQTYQEEYGTREGDYDTLAIIDELYLRTRECFPGAGEVKYQIKVMPELSGEKLYAAFYLKDSDKGMNYVYVRAGAEGEAFLSLYQIMAHETFPGHMYCSDFQKAKRYPTLDKLLKCPGYSEGWAVYAEFAAAEWLEAGKAEYIGIVKQKLLDEVFLAQADIGVHGMGWTAGEVEAFMEEVYGVGDVGRAGKIYQIVLDNPGAYQPYVTGYFQLKDLEKEYCDEKGMDISTFLTHYLECGPAPFDFIRNYLLRCMTDGPGPA